MCVYKSETRRCMRIRVLNDAAEIEAEKKKLKAEIPRYVEGSGIEHG